jgi:hypothetical protein
VWHFRGRSAVKDLSQDELVQMGVCPAHGKLNDSVKPNEGHVRPHLDPAPDGRLRPFERDFDLIQTPSRRGVGSGDISHIRAILEKTGPKEQENLAG